MTTEIDGRTTFFLNMRNHYESANPGTKEGKPSFSAFLKAYDIQPVDQSASLTSPPVSKEVLTDVLLNPSKMQSQRATTLEYNSMIQDVSEASIVVGQLFANAGMPFIDAVKIDQTPMGTFKISGWGKGVPVSHPQAKFIEAVLNGQAPGYADLTDKINSQIEKIETLFSKSQDFLEENSELLDKPFTRQDSIFDESLILGSEYLSTVEGAARKLSWSQSGRFDAFKASLGSELEKLTDRQVLSRFHFNTVTLPTLQGEFGAFF